MPYRVIVAILIAALIAGGVSLLIERQRSSDELPGARTALRGFLDAVKAGDQARASTFTDGLFDDPLFACAWADPALGDLKGNISLLNRGSRPIAAAVFAERGRLGLTLEDQPGQGWTITANGVGGATKPSDLAQSTATSYVSAVRRGDERCRTATSTPRARDLGALRSAWTVPVATAAGAQGPPVVDIGRGPATGTAVATFGAAAPPLALVDTGGGRWLVDGLATAPPGG